MTDKEALVACPDCGYNNCFDVDGTCTNCGYNPSDAKKEVLCTNCMRHDAIKDGLCANCRTSPVPAIVSPDENKPSGEKCKKDHCLSCGAKSNEDDVYCGNCGKKLVTAQPKTIPVAIPVQAHIPAPADVIGRKWNGGENHLTKSQRNSARRFFGFHHDSWNGHPDIAVPKIWEYLWHMPFEHLAIIDCYNFIVAVGFTAKNWGKPCERKYQQDHGEYY